MTALAEHDVIKVICGLEGGASGSRIVLCDHKGTILSDTDGPSTNPWYSGYDIAINRIIELLKRAIENANLDKPCVLTHLCLSMSGVDTEDNQKRIKVGIKNADASLANCKIHVCNDSIGTFLTASDQNAIVLIAGTGSICNYIRSDLTYRRIGGYGYLLGDGGSAYWISIQVIKYYLKADDLMIDDDDSNSAYDIQRVRKEIYSHFGIENNLDLLSKFYETFQKDQVAQLCEKIAILARKGDELCRHMFYSAGVQLALHVKAALKYSAQDMSQSCNSMTVICCGSLFKSWDLLSEGFKKTLTKKLANDETWSGVLKLVRLERSAAYGATRLAALQDPAILLPLRSEWYSELDRTGFMI